MTTLISADQSILLWAVVLVVVAVAIRLEQRYKWAAAFGSVVIVLLTGLLLSNIHVVPYSAGTFSALGNIVLPCSIPLFLFKANVKQILKDSGKLFIVFHIASVGTVIGVLVSYLIFKNAANCSELCCIITAACVGGTVNCVAMGNIFVFPEGLLASYLVVGNFFCASMIVLFKVMHNTDFVKKFLPRPYSEKAESASAEDLAAGKTQAALFWGGKEIGLKDIATALATTFAIVGVSGVIANWVVSLNPPQFIAQSFGSIYLVMTLITTILATAFPKFFNSINGSMELGNVGLLAWFFTIGASGNIVDIIKGSALSLGILFIVLIFNLGISMVGAKLIKGTWEDAVLAATATIGGPPTAAAVSVAFNWSELVIPGILVGLWGYIIGNYFGIIVGNLLGVASIL